MKYIYTVFVEIFSWYTVEWKKQVIYPIIHYIIWHVYVLIGFKRKWGYAMNFLHCSHWGIRVLDELHAAVYLSFHLWIFINIFYYKNVSIKNSSWSTKYLAERDIESLFFWLMWSFISLKSYSTFYIEINSFLMFHILVLFTLWYYELFMFFFFFPLCYYENFQMYRGFERIIMWTLNYTVYTYTPSHTYHLNLTLVIFLYLLYYTSIQPSICITS